MSSAVAVWCFIFRNAKRAFVAIVGFGLVAAGLAMLVLPGPGLLLIIGGLAVLATEFAWAATALDKAKERGEEAKQTAKRLNARRRGKSASESEV